MTSKGIAIAADSVCDLPPSLVDALGIHIIPTYVNIAGASYADDGKQLDRQRYYRELPGMTAQPTTAAPSPGDAAEFYRGILDAGADEIISLHVPAKLSGVLNAMRLGAEAVDSERITLVDSLQLAFGMGMQVWAAAELARDGCEREEILAGIERARRQTRVYAIVDNMEYLRRSGRVTALTASLGGLLKIKPVIEVANGEVASIGRLRTWKRALRRLQDLTREQSPLERLAILHVDNRAGAEAFKAALQDTAPSDTLIIETTPTIGTHIGPGALGVATLKRNWRQ